MRKLLGPALFSAVVLMLCVLVRVGPRAPIRSVGAQAQTQSGIPQPRPVGTVAVAVGQVVTGQSGCAGLRCVVPTTTTGPAAGIALMAGNPGDTILVSMYGVAYCTFDNTPVQGDTAVNSGTGLCHDVTGARTGVSNLVGTIGSVSNVVDSTHALVTQFGPTEVGNLVDTSTIAATGTRSGTTYLRGDGTWASAPASSGTTTINTIPCDLGSTCTIPVGTGTVTGVTGTSPITSTGGTNPAIGCPTCVTSLPAQNVTYYTTAGATISGVKRIPFSVTTAANGTWSVSYSAVGCTTVRTWNVSTISPTGTLATQQYTPFVQVASTTTMSGTVYSGAVLSLLGATIIPITVATTVTGEMVCT